jgi:hypothetical protein
MAYRRGASVCSGDSYGHPTITGLNDHGRFPYESLDTLFSTLTTLPALESITLGAPAVRQADESALAHPESLTELLRVPTLRSVRYCRFYFTRALCQATANALMEGTAVTKLEFINCSFSAVDCDVIMARGLARNTSVSRINVVSRFNGVPVLYGTLAAVLLSLGQNTGLKSLQVNWYGSMVESLCTAIKNGLEMNETLESLELSRVHLTDDNSALWCRALFFLRTNKALKSLIITLPRDVTGPYLSSFRIDIATMLQENTSLESLSFQNMYYGIETMETERCIALVTALQHNTTLKTLRIYRNGSLRLNRDESKRMVSLLKKKLCTGKSSSFLPDGSGGRRRRHLATEWSRTSVSN